MQGGLRHPPAPLGIGRWVWLGRLVVCRRDCSGSTFFMRPKPAICFGCGTSDFGIDFEDGVMADSASLRFIE